MLKRDAIRLLIGAEDVRQVLKEGTGDYVHGVFTKAARVIGVTPQAVQGWPESLRRPTADRVLAILYRREHGEQVSETTAQL